MAHIRKCKYCPGIVCDAEFHPECRIEHLENLLKELLRTVDEPSESAETGNYRKLKDCFKILHRENWHPKSESEKQLQGEKEVTDADKTREIAKAEAIRVFAQNWDIEHPQLANTPPFGKKQYIEESSDLLGTRDDN